jgi:hypothetical protein
MGSCSATLVPACVSFKQSPIRTSICSSDPTLTASSLIPRNSRSERPHSSQTPKSSTPSHPPQNPLSLPPTKFNSAPSKIRTPCSSLQLALLPNIQHHKHKNRTLRHPPPPHSQQSHSPEYGPNQPNSHLILQLHPHQHGPTHRTSQVSNGLFSTVKVIITLAQTNRPVQSPIE